VPSGTQQAKINRVPNGTPNYGNIRFLPIYNPDGIIFGTHIF